MIDGVTRYVVHGLWNSAVIVLSNGSLPRFMERQPLATNTEIGRVTFSRVVLRNRTEFSIRKLIPSARQKKVPLSIVAIPRDLKGRLDTTDSVVLHKWHSSSLELVSNPSLATLIQGFVAKALRSKRTTDRALTGEEYGSTEEENI